MNEPGAARPVRLAGPLDLAHTLQGGQAFRWRREEGDAFLGAIGARLVRLAQVGETVEAIGAPRAALARYFRLEPADAQRRERLARDPVLAPAIRALPGLRMLRQDPWETTVAFLTSANNNVPRIELIMRALARAHGEALSEHDFAFPAPEHLARVSETRLRAAGLGYRAPFLREAARAVARGDVDLAALRGASRDEARASLVALPGVGPKVADCIALFALDVDDAFPVDRWVLRAMEEAFSRAFTLKDCAGFARERWGNDAGLAQQYLFHAARMRAAAPGVARVKMPPMKG